MAIVTFNKADFEKMLGKKLSEKEYFERVPMIGVTLEGLSDLEVSFDVPPDRPDLLSVEGFARALQGFLGYKTGLVSYTVRKSNYRVVVYKSVLKKRGCCAFAVVKNLPKFTDETVAEFMQLQDKLVYTIGRKRKKSAVGTYDLDDLHFPVDYTTVPPDFKYIPLLSETEMSVKEMEEKHPRGLEYRHIAEGWDSYPAFIDSKDNTMAVLPYSNAQFAKIKPETTNLFVEVTGTEWKSVFEMLNVVTTALADRGGTVYEVKTVYPGNKIVKAPKLEPWKMRLDVNYANKLLDLNLKPIEVKAHLERMRFGTSANTVLVPAYRVDVMHPIDLVEDIAIAHGYEKFEPRIPRIATIGKPLELNEHCNELRAVMLGLGFQEVVNFVLSNQKKEFEMVNKKPENFVKIKNPKTEDYTIGRVSLIPSLLSVFEQNSSREMPQKIFELGTTLQIDDNSETGAVNSLKLGAGILHSNANYSEMKSYVEGFFRELGKKVEFKGLKDASFIGGRVAELLVDGKAVGKLGEVHPQVLTNFNLEYPVSLFEIDLKEL